MQKSGHIIFVMIFVFLLFLIKPPMSVCQQTETKKQEEVKQDPQEEESTNINLEDDERPEHLKYWKTKYEFVFNAPFETVIKSIKKSIVDFGCVVAQQTNKQNKDGFLSTKITTDYCVFSQDRDSTLDALKKYSLRLPLIYGGRWKNGRVQFKFSLDEQTNSNVRLVLKAEISGYEDFVTYEFHFWESGGLMEHDIMELVIKNINEASKKKE